jgi:VCBS repeat-containing protein
VWVCATLSSVSTGTGVAATFFLTDGSNNIIQASGGWNEPVSTNNMGTVSCGLYTASSTSVTFKVRAASGGSHNLAIQSASGNDTALEFSVFMVH